ncbi:uncharacterized protein LOC144312403 [Canis aureus]
MFLRGLDLSSARLHIQNSRQGCFHCPTDELQQWEVAVEKITSSGSCQTRIIQDNSRQDEEVMVQAKTVHSSWLLSQATKEKEGRNTTWLQLYQIPTLDSP